MQANDIQMSYYTCLLCGQSRIELEGELQSGLSRYGLSQLHQRQSELSTTSPPQTLPTKRKSECMSVVGHCLLSFPADSGRCSEKQSSTSSDQPQHLRHLPHRIGDASLAFLPEKNALAVVRHIWVAGMICRYYTHKPTVSAVDLRTGSQNMTTTLLVYTTRSNNVPESTINTRRLGDLPRPDSRSRLRSLSSHVVDLPLPEDLVI